MRGCSEVAQDQVSQRPEHDHEAEEGSHVAPEGQRAAVPSHQLVSGDVRHVAGNTAVELGLDGSTPVDRRDGALVRCSVAWNTQKCGADHVGS